MDPGMQIDEFFMSSELCHKDTGGCRLQGYGVAHEFGFWVSRTARELKEALRLTSSMARLLRSPRLVLLRMRALVPVLAARAECVKPHLFLQGPSSEQSNLAGESEDLAQGLSEDEPEHGNGDLSRDVVPAAKGHSMPRSCEAVLAPSEPDKLRKRPVRETVAA
eukprot:s5660_g7.t1